MGPVVELRQRASRRPLLADGLAAALLFALSLTAAAIADRTSRRVPPSFGSVPAGTVVVAAVACGVLLLRRKRPRATLAVSVCCAAAYLALGYDLNPVLVSPVVAAICTLALDTDRRTAWLGASAAALVLVASDLRLDVLTPRERDMMALVAQGHSNEEIARRLYLSPLTVKTHVNRAMTKLGARDRAQLVVLAYQCGLVRPGTRPLPTAPAAGGLLRIGVLRPQ
jgi:DNA-binding CsgD family transcriptional regulator